MRLPEWGLSEKRWKKDPNEEIRPAKTAWDWLQLLVVPIALAVLAIAFNGWQSNREAELARDRRLDDVIQTYLSQMSDLLLRNDLQRSRVGSNVQSVARTLTLTALQRLDDPRKREVLNFLLDAELITTSVRKGEFTRPKVRLHGANLRRMTFPSDLNDMSLAGADLRAARFDGIELHTMDFGKADLSDASFRGASVSNVSFRESLLTRANFDRTYFAAVQADYYDYRSGFDNACVTEASFRDADFSDGDLGGAVGERVDLTGATLTREDLKGAILVDAKLPKSLGGDLPADWAPTASGMSMDLSALVMLLCDGRDGGSP